ncbi:MAG TPA: glycogen debranching protein [Chloroflexota bacterium]|nr:glycogen debranching protein [Chloroflexota bacterium]
MVTEQLRDAALAVLHGNDLGDWTKPAPRLYPHQWSWDSAFIAIGLASIDADRALRELESLFRAQWEDGRLPHIVFNPAAADYFPGPERWATAELTSAAPRTPRTSGLVQPPVHALALERIWEVGSAAIRKRVETLLPAAIAWHRYLATKRDPDGSGLLSIYHPWESGTDNSPRWDATFEKLEVGESPAYTRHDLKHVADPSERPTKAEYDRYLWLVELLKDARYDDAVIHRDHPFLIKDMLMSGIFATASEALARLSGSSDVAAWGERAAAGVLRNVSADGLTLDIDVRAGSPIDVKTCAGLAWLLVPGLTVDQVQRASDLVFGPWFAGASGLAHKVVPSTAPGSPGFQSRSYWRGPSWPHMNWLVWRALLRNYQEAQARELKAQNLALLARPESRFAEYFEPFTAEPLGSLDQSWSAAVALDWLAAAD